MLAIGFPYRWSPLVTDLAVYDYANFDDKIFWLAMLTQSMSVMGAGIVVGS